MKRVQPLANANPAPPGAATRTLLQGISQTARLALTLLRRKPGSVQLLLMASLLFAVTLVCSMLMFTGRVERAIYLENAALLAADAQLDSSRPFTTAELSSLQEQAGRAGLSTVQTVELASMLYANDELLLSRVLAVQPGYPLRGTLLAAAALESSPVPAARTPGRGEIWLDARAARQLGVTPGEEVELGRLSLRFAAVLGAEPGTMLPSLGLAGNALISLDDLSASGLIMPGSRASWRLLLAGEPQAVRAFSARVAPQLASHQRLRSSLQGSEGGAQMTRRALDYMNLGAGVALVMATIAALVAGMQFVDSETRGVAVLKALGFSSRVLLGAYLLMFALWWAAATALGCLLAAVMVNTGFDLLAPDLGIPRVSPLTPIGVAALVALGVSASFVLPSLYALARIAPQRLLRDAQSARSSLAPLLLLPLLYLLLVLLGRSWSAAAQLFAALLALAFLSWLCARLLMRLLEFALARAGEAYAGQAIAGQGIEGKSSAVLSFAVLWRQGAAALLRQRRANAMRIAALSSTVALVVVVVGLRDNLLDSWRAQLPADAPNFFAINISAASAASWEAWLQQRGMTSQGAFAVARARLEQVNGESASERIELHDGNARSLAREFVMTESREIPRDNEIVAGRWHGDREVAEVSAEQGITERLGLQLGDRLRFSFAGQPLDVTLSSIRSLDWESMQPNFYFVLAEPQLRQYPHSFMGSFHAPEQRQQKLSTMVGSFPEITLIDLDAVIEQLQRLLERVGLAVETLASITLAAALLVLATSLRASLHARVHEHRLLRALGASAASLRRIAWAELGITGLLAGLAGCAIGSAMLLLLARQGFDIVLYLSASQLAWQLLLAVLLVLITGELILRPVYRSSPLQAWKKAS